jgi:hypothetical protein
MGPYGELGFKGPVCCETENCPATQKVDSSDFRAVGEHLPSITSDVHKIFPVTAFQAVMGLSRKAGVSIYIGMYRQNWSQLRCKGASAEISD